MVLKCSILFLSIIWILWAPSSKAASTLNAIDWLNYVVEIAWAYMDQYFSMVHYNVKWNDFWGWILWLPVEQITWDAVEITIPSDNEWGTDSRFCSSKVRWFYWNSQRWDNRRWPLDDVTHEWLKNANPDEEKYAWLTISWWLYTTCSEDRVSVELNKYLDDNGISITLPEIAKILEKLKDVDRDQWDTTINKELENYKLDSVSIEKIKEALLTTWTTFDIDPYWIYWRITHNYGWQKIDLIAWAHYDMDQNRISTWNLTCSLQRLSNNYPFWYIYDDYWHIGLIWARISSNYVQWSEKHKEMVMNFHSGLNQLLNSWWPSWKWVCMNEIFWFDWKNMKLMKQEMSQIGSGYDIPGRSDNKDIWQTIRSLAEFLTAWNGTARTTVFSLWIKGIVWLTDEVRDSQKEYFENNQLQSTLMLRTETSISNIVNSVTRNAERICRWKWNTNWINWSALTSNDNIVCLSWSSALSATAPTPKQLAWRTVVVRNADLIINMNWSDHWNDDIINLFVDRWNLLLDVNENTKANLKSFDDYWYLTTEGEIKAMFLKGNFIINWLILWWTSWTGTINHRLYMHGKLISYNTITVPTTTRKKTIAHIIWRNWTEATVPEWTSLTKLFAWSCNAVSWEGTDWTSCKWSSAVWKESQLVDKAFWLIDMDLPSELITY